MTICICCGCTEADPCVDKQGYRCCWAVYPEPPSNVGLCSACVPSFEVFSRRGVASRDVAEFHRLERRIATSSAVASIVSFGHFCPPNADHIGLLGSWWAEPSNEDDREDFTEACRYLELRGLLEKHPDLPGLVRPKQELIRE